MIASFLCWIMGLALAPLLLGVVNRTKALFAGRKGAPLLQTYYDLAKQFQKGAVYSTTTTWVFRSAPVLGVICALLALAMVPVAGIPGLVGFSGDFILALYLLALARFSYILAGLDTGSAFTGMGASREAWVASLAEPALLLGMAALAKQTQSLSLSQMIPMLALTFSQPSAPALLLVAAAWFLVLLAENARIPVDDPNTHLELTMIHEAMVLDHSGPDFGLILYAASLKLWLFGMLLVDLLMPVRTGSFPMDAGIALAMMAAVAVMVGVVESSMARLRLGRIPQLLMTAAALSGLALILTLR